MNKIELKYLKQCAVIIRYSFDPETSVVICENYESAQKFIKESFKNEMKIDKEENGWEIDENLTVCDDNHAVLATIYPSNTEPECTYWTIANNAYEKSESTESMTKERTMELLNEIIDYVAISRDTSEQIDELTSMGFTFEELVKDFNYSESDIEDFELQI